MSLVIFLIQYFHSSKETFYFYTILPCPLASAQLSFPRHLLPATNWTIPWSILNIQPTGLHEKTRRQMLLLVWFSFLLWKVRESLGQKRIKPTTTHFTWARVQRTSVPHVGAKGAAGTAACKSVPLLRNTLLHAVVSLHMYFIVIISTSANRSCKNQAGREMKKWIREG